MPNREGHELVDLLLVGRRHPEVHIAKDAKWALRKYGPGHRKYGHGLMADMVLAAVYGWSPEQLVAAMGHDLADGVLLK